ncbi:DUF1992 domain-containing protein [Sciscionella sediminilitoris]|uniref:DnaJ family domain-containing protein n=1 Tax=Sciscionella sediminilitoris TaxID=1445613 RepID=UPI0004DF9E74|nr:DUF1992 domain-containing protein [Sciscionella sp. SE31]
MTEKKPRDMPFESWVDKQVREASERGEFDDLPGYGKPLPGAGERYDELWWVKDKIRRENITHLPGPFAIRKAAEDAHRAALEAKTERGAREIIETVNDRIREELRRPSDGPPLGVRPFDVDAVLTEWRRAHA